MTDSLPLVVPTRNTLDELRDWARAKNASDLFVDEMIPALFVASALQRDVNGGDGIDAAVIVAQSAKETGWGKFGGVINASFHNTAGIKTSQGGPNDAPDAHERFDSWAEGARAHVNHLAAYVGLEPVGEPHGRYHVVKRLSWAGTVETAEELSGRWAPSSTYADSIIAHVRELHALADSRDAEDDIPSDDYMTRAEVEDMVRDVMAGVIQVMILSLHQALISLLDDEAKK